MVADTSTGAVIDDPLSPKNWAIASGLSDTIVATYDPPLTTRIDGMTVAFRASAANLSTTPTFNPNGLGATQITKNGGQNLAVGDIAGPRAEVLLRWNAADGTWEMLNPPAIPVGGIVPYFGGAVPSGFVLPQGQNFAIASFPAAFSVFGTTYGNPGGGNFTMPDLRGRTMAALDAGGSNRLNGVMASATLGSVGGAQAVNLSSAQIPQLSTSYTPQGNIAVGPSAVQGITGGVSSGTPSEAGGNTPAGITATFSGTAATISVGTTSPGPVATVQPTMVVNVMMRIA